MKRSKFLQPLSRDHHAALVLAKACERAALSDNELQIYTACERAGNVFQADLAAHFQIEEVSLLPLLLGTDSEILASRALTEHKQLRGLIGDIQLKNREALGAFGKCLAEHVRFEERELFPAIEKLL